MIYKIVYLSSAKQDLKELRAYILKNFSQQQWQITFTKLKTAIENLQQFPFSGSLPDEVEKLNLSQYWQIVSGMNRVIYEVRQETVYIHVIVDSRRDMQGLLMRRLMRS